MGRSVEAAPERVKQERELELIEELSDSLEKALQEDCDLLRAL